MFLIFLLQLLTSPNEEFCQDILFEGFLLNHFQYLFVFHLLLLLCKQYVVLLEIHYILYIPPPFPLFLLLNQCLFDQNMLLLILPNKINPCLLGVINICLLSNILQRFYTSLLPYIIALYLSCSST